jgi:membrane-associated protein
MGIVREHTVEVLIQLIDLLLHFDRHLLEMIDGIGDWTYVILFLIVFCETGLVVTPFLPGDSLLFAAGALAARQSLSLPVSLVLLAVAAVLGDAVNYAIGAKFGERFLATQRIPWIRKKHLDQTHDFFERYGNKTIVIARFVPIVRTFAPFVAGIGQMGYRQFALYNVVGGCAWVLSFTLLGYFIGNIQTVKDHFSLIVIGIIVISVLPMVWEVVLGYRRRRAVTTSETPSTDS